MAAADIVGAVGLMKLNCRQHNAAKAGAHIFAVHFFCSSYFLRCDTIVGLPENYNSKNVSVTKQIPDLER